MIDLYTDSTPNGRKVSIMLEEVALPYAVHRIDISKGDQFGADFLRISPNNKIPAIIDRDAEGGPLSIFESGAILIYLAEITGKLMPAARRARMQVMQWLMFQMGTVGPMFGQAHHFRRFAPEQVPYAVERYTKETHRIYGVMDRRLAQVPYLAGDYTIADIACWPWVARWEWHGIRWQDFPHVKLWFDSVAMRPAVERGRRVPHT